MRRLSLTVWGPKGPAETWRAQLEEYYHRSPCLRSWGALPRQSGRRSISSASTQGPCDLPHNGIPRDLGAERSRVLPFRKACTRRVKPRPGPCTGKRTLPKEISIVQVFRNDRAGLILSKAFDETWTGLGHAAPENRVLAKEETPTASFWKKLGDKNKHRVLLLWLDAGVFQELDNLARSAAVCPAWS